MPFPILTQELEHVDICLSPVATRAVGENDPVSVTAGHHRVEACNPVHFVSAAWVDPFVVTRS